MNPSKVLCKCTGAQPAKHHHFVIKMTVIVLCISFCVPSMQLSQKGQYSCHVFRPKTPSAPCHEEGSRKGGGRGPREEDMEGEDLEIKG